MYVYLCSVLKSEIVYRGTKGLCVGALLFLLNPCVFHSSVSPNRACSYRGQNVSEHRTLNACIRTFAGSANTELIKSGLFPYTKE